MSVSAAAAKVLRGGRSGFSSRLLGSSTAHKGQWRNPALSEGANVRAPERMEQLCSKRSLHVEPKREPKRERVEPHPMAIVFLITTCGGALYTYQPLTVQLGAVSRRTSSCHHGAAQ